MRFCLSHPTIRCWEVTAADGTKYGCDHLKVVAPERAYKCSTCPLPKADPGPEIRSIYTLYNFIFAFPENSIFFKDRWARVRRSMPTEQWDDLLSSFYVIRAIVDRTNVAAQAVAQAQIEANLALKKRQSRI